MPDNLVLSADSGTLVASDEVDGVQVLRTKLQHGPAGEATDASRASPLPVTDRSPSLAVFRYIGLGTTPQAARSGTGELFGWHLANSGSAAAFVKVYDALSPTVGTDTPALTIFVPAGGAVSARPSRGLDFANGIALAATAGVSDNDTTPPADGTVIVNLFYR